MWLRHLPRSRQRGQAAPHSGTRKGVEAGDEQMKDLTLGPPPGPPPMKDLSLPAHQFDCRAPVDLWAHPR